MTVMFIEPRLIGCAEHSLRSGRSVVVGGDGAVFDVTPERPTLDAERIVLPEILLIPGLINPHNHALSAPLFCGFADDIAPGDVPGHMGFSLLMPLAMSRPRS